MLYKLYIYQYLFSLHFHCDILLLQRVISNHGIIHLHVHVIYFSLVCVVLFFKASILCFDINCYHHFILIRYDFSNAFFLFPMFFIFLLIQNLTANYSLSLSLCAVFTS